MTTTTREPGSKPAPRHGFRSNDYKREMRRAVNMAALLERGYDLPSADIVPLPKRNESFRKGPPAGASATILLFTGVVRELRA